MPLGTKAVATALALGLALVGCSGEDTISADTPLSEAEIDDQTLAEASEVTKGIFTEGEVKCILEGLADRGFTAGQVVEHQRTPKPGPVQDAYLELVPGCIDKAAVVEPVPLSPQLRDQLIKGATSGDSPLTAEQAGCFIDGLIANGVAPRDLVLADYDQTIYKNKIEPVVGKVESCFQPGS